MEKIAETHGGGAVRGTWTDIDPTRYDEAHEVQGLELDPGYFISPTTCRTVYGCSSQPAGAT